MARGKRMLGGYIEFHLVEHIEKKYDNNTEWIRRLAEADYLASMGIDVKKKEEILTKLDEEKKKKEEAESQISILEQNLVDIQKEEKKRKKKLEKQNESDAVKNYDMLRGSLGAVK